VTTAVESWASLSIAYGNGASASSLAKRLTSTAGARKPSVDDDRLAFLSGSVP